MVGALHPAPHAALKDHPAPHAALNQGVPGVPENPYILQFYTKPHNRWTILLAVAGAARSWWDKHPRLCAALNVEPLMMICRSSEMGGQTRASVEEGQILVLSGQGSSGECSLRRGRNETLRWWGSTAECTREGGVLMVVCKYVPYAWAAHQNAPSWPPGSPLVTPTSVSEGHSGML